MRYSSHHPDQPAFSRFLSTCCIPVLACLLAGYLAMAPVPTWAADLQVIHEGSFSASRLEWKSDQQGTPYPAFSDTRVLGEPGLPQLPAREYTFLVPLEFEVEEIWIEPLETSRLKTDQPLALAPPHLLDSGETISVTRMSREDGSFPSVWGEFTGNHVWRGYRLATVTVYPVRHHQSGEGSELEILERFAVRVKTGAGIEDYSLALRERRVPGEAEENARILAQLVANPQDIPGYNRQHGQEIQDKSAAFAPTPTPSLIGSRVTFLIITNEDMKDQFQTLADFRIAQGIPTVVTTREFIAANFRNGADIQETIRLFIRDAYSKWGVEYVMLGGDSDILPPRYVDNTLYGTGGYTSIPVDLYFGCLDGNWNDDGDSHFGEHAYFTDPGDLVDFADEVHVGRATVSTPADAAVFVDKIISYESVGSSADWANRVLFAAEVLFPEDWPANDIITLDGALYADQQVNEFIEPCTDLEYMRMYQTDTVFPWDTPLTRNALIDTLNTGRYGILNQIGHGSYFVMSVADANFSTTDADNLTNGDHQLVVYALNCASGAFDKSCLLERFIQNPNGGSVCSIGSARAAFPNTSNNYQQEFFEYLYCGDEMRAGRMVSLSRIPFLGLTSANSLDRWTFENYTLLGDPTLAIWSGTPATLQVSGPSDLDLGPQNLVYSVTRGSLPVENALVCISKDDESIAQGYTDAAGLVDLDFLPTTVGQAKLTVTGKNLARQSQQLSVASGNAFTALTSMTIDDGGAEPSVGNGNQVMESGEVIAMTALLLETGGTGTAGLTGVISCADTNVTLLVDTAAFPAVPAGGSTSSLTPYLAYFDPAIPDGSEIQFQIEVTNGPETYLSHWTAMVHAPEIEVVSMDWEDTTYGNGNGLMENGERIRLTTILKNFGTGVTDNLTGHLRTDEVNVTLLDSTSTWTDIGSFREAAGSLTYSFSLANIFGGDTFRFDFVDNYGRTFSHHFTPGRPDVPTNLTTDNSQGPNIIALTWDPSASSDRLGYNVFRSDSEFGDYVQVNPDIIHGTSYFRDENLLEFTQYFYKVATVDSSLVPSGFSAATGASTGPAEREGFPVSFGEETSSHLAVGDLDGDGDNEIVLANSQVYAFQHDGQEVRDGDGESQTNGVFSDFPAGYLLQPSGILMANLDNVAGQEIIVSERAPGYRIHILTKDGSELPGWPQTLSTTQGGTKWNWATPALGDIDGDGLQELVVHGLNGVIYAWNIDGTEVRDGDSNAGTNGVFYVRAGAKFEWSRSGPALYDLDGDGAEDIIFGTREDSSGLTRIMALKVDGTNVPGFPYITHGGITVDPCVGDLDNNGQVEIVVTDSAEYVYAVQQDGSDYPGFPSYLGYPALHAWVSSPGLGDMDNDGMLEIICAPNESGSLSRLLVVDTDHVAGTSGQVMSGWPVTLPGSSEGSPVIGDIDGDQIPDIIHGMGGGDLNAPFNLYAYKADGSLMNGFPLTLNGPLMPSAAITDIDGDWDVDIVYGGWDALVHVWDMPFAYDPVFVPWPTYRGNYKRDGVLIPRSLVPVEDPDQIPMANFTVLATYPNPFNPSTEIRLYIPQSSELDVAVYDVMGRKVRQLHTGTISSGWHSLIWDGRDDNNRGMSSGMYFLRADNAGEVSVQKMTMVK